MKGLNPRWSHGPRQLVLLLAAVTTSLGVAADRWTAADHFPGSRSDPSLSYIERVESDPERLPVGTYRAIAADPTTAAGQVEGYRFRPLEEERGRPPSGRPAEPPAAPRYRGGAPVTTERDGGAERWRADAPPHRFVPEDRQRARGTRPPALPRAGAYWPPYGIAPPIAPGWGGTGPWPPYSR